MINKKETRNSLITALIGIFVMTIIIHSALEDKIHKKYMKQPKAYNSVVGKIRSNIR